MCLTQKQCAGRYNKQFDLIKEEVSQLTDALWELSVFEKIHGTSLYGADAVQRVLSSSYQTLLKFWYRCTKILESPGRYVFSTNTKLQRLVEELESNCQYLSRIRDSVEAHFNMETRESISAEQVHAAAERAAASEDRKLAQCERQKAEVERQKAEAERKVAEEERRRAEEERRKAQKEREQMEVERQRAEDQRQKAEIRYAEETEKQNGMVKTFIMLAHLLGRSAHVTER